MALSSFRKEAANTREILEVSFRLGKILAVTDGINGKTLMARIIAALIVQSKSLKMKILLAHVECCCSLLMEQLQKQRMTTIPVQI